MIALYLLMVAGFLCFVSSCLVVYNQLAVNKGFKALIASRLSGCFGFGTLAVVSLYCKQNLAATIIFIVLLLLVTDFMRINDLRKKAKLLGSKRET